MGRPLHTDKEDIEYAEKLLKEAKSAEEIRMAQAVLLPEKLKMTFEQVAVSLGTSLRTVPRLRKRLKEKRLGECSVGKRGGRRRENMSVEAEKSLLLIKTL